MGVATRAPGCLRARVGWVERRETHRLANRMMGFTVFNPSTWFEATRRNRGWLSPHSARARLPARGRSRAEGRGPRPAARACPVPSRAQSRQIGRCGARTRLVTVRHAGERAAPKPPRLLPRRRHRRRPGVRSMLRWSHRPAPNRFAARPAPSLYFEEGRRNVDG